MGAVVNNLGKGGGKTKGVGDVFLGVSVGSTYFWVGDVGDDPPHGTGYWGVSTQGIYMDHWEVAPSVSGRKLIVPTFGDGDTGGRI